MNVTVKAGVAPSIEIACASDGIDLVVPNLALMAWVEQQLGKAPEGLYADDQGEDPWREIQELFDHVKDATGVRGTHHGWATVAGGGVLAGLGYGLRRRVFRS